MRIAHWRAMRVPPGSKAMSSLTVRVHGNRRDPSIGPPKAGTCERYIPRVPMASRRGAELPRRFSAPRGFATAWFGAASGPSVKLEDVDVRFTAGICRWHPDFQRPQRVGRPLPGSRWASAKRAVTEASRPRTGFTVETRGSCPVGLNGQREDAGASRGNSLPSQQRQVLACDRVLAARLNRSRLGPFEGPAIESPRVCRGIVTYCIKTGKLQFRSSRSLWSARKSRS